MLDEGRARLLNAGLAGNIDYVLADAEALPFAAAELSLRDDRLRSAQRHGQRARARELVQRAEARRPVARARVLARGTRARSRRSTSSTRCRCCRASANGWPGDSASYRYLAESIRRHPDQETLKAMMERAGFERCEYFNLTAGIVALHVGHRL